MDLLHTYTAVQALLEPPCSSYLVDITTELTTSEIAMYRYGGDDSTSSPTVRHY